jgi:parallel beta-helix repeat protein
MAKRIVLTAILICLLIAGIGCVRVAKANFIPEPTPEGIIIQADGSISGTDQIEKDGKTYRLTGDLNKTLAILCDNIVIDGAGFTISGQDNSTGVFLQQRSNVTIKNLVVKNFCWAIKLTYGLGIEGSRGINISSSTLTNNTYGIVLGLFSGNATLLNNTITGNEYGIYFSYSSGNMLRNNVMNDNRYNLWVDCELSSSAYSLANDVDASNTVDGKPVCYWVNQQNKAVPADAGYVALVLCNNITVQNLQLSGNGQGVLLASTNRSLITNNNLTNNNYGIALFGPNAPCTDNTITGNRIENNTKDGIFTWDNTGTNITQNTISNSQENGLNLFNAKKAVITGNNVTGNGETGIKLWGYDLTGPQLISQNYVAKNGLGIELDWDNSGDAARSLVTQNTLIENNRYGLKISGEQQNNQIYLNNFINNNASGLQVGQPGRWTAQGDLPGKANAWDNGTFGNYWSDYLTRYPDASEVANTGTGDTPFYINENNQDNHPLMEPVALVMAETPDPTVTPSPSPITPSPSPLSSHSSAPSEEPTLTPTTSTTISAQTITPTATTTPTTTATPAPTNTSPAATQNGNTQDINVYIAITAVVVIVVFAAVAIVFSKRSHKTAGVNGP